MHKDARGLPRKKRIEQIRENQKSVRNFTDYIPTEGTIERLRGWERQGAELSYLTSHRSIDDVKKDEFVMRRHNFPSGPVLYRLGNETYADIVERQSPDIFIEDDCESIGGEPEMASPHLRPWVKKRMKIIVVPECGGLEHLPESLDQLLQM